MYATWPLSSFYALFFKKSLKEVNRGSYFSPLSAEINGCVLGDLENFTSHSFFNMLNSFKKKEKKKKNL